jgi:hypothetical protein
MFDKDSPIMEPMYMSMPLSVLGVLERERDLFHDNGGNQPCHSLCRLHKVDLASFFLLYEYLTATTKRHLNFVPEANSNNQETFNT